MATKALLFGFCLLYHTLFVTAVPTLTETVFVCDTAAPAYTIIPSLSYSSSAISIGGSVILSSAVKPKSSSSIINYPSSFSQLIAEVSTSDISPIQTITGSPSATQYATSTVYSTTIYTITSCAPSVTDCPGKLGSVTTDIISLYMTICPVTAIEGSGTSLSLATSTPLVSSYSSKPSRAYTNSTIVSPPTSHSQSSSSLASGYPYSTGASSSSTPVTSQNSTISTLATTPTSSIANVTFSESTSQTSSPVTTSTQTRSVTTALPRTITVIQTLDVTQTVYSVSTVTPTVYEIVTANSTQTNTVSSTVFTTQTIILTEAFLATITTLATTTDATEALSVTHTSHAVDIERRDIGAEIVPKGFWEQISTGIYTVTSIQTFVVGTVTQYLTVTDEVDFTTVISTFTPLNNYTHWYTYTINTSITVTASSTTTATATTTTFSTRPDKI